MEISALGRGMARGGWGEGEARGEASEAQRCLSVSGVCLAGRSAAGGACRGAGRVKRSGEGGRLAGVYFSHHDVAILCAQSVPLGSAATAAQQNNNKQAVAFSSIAQQL